MSRSLGEMFQKVQQMKSLVDEKRQELAGRNVTAESGGIKAVVSCDKRIVSIDIGESALKEPVDKEKLQKELLASINGALEKAEKIQKEEANKALGSIGLNLPGLF